MEFLRASWGYVVMIGGLLLTLIVLTILDWPAQLRDAERRASEAKSSGEGKSPERPSAAPVAAAAAPKPHAPGPVSG
jgi:hypothetical protein